MSNPTQAASQPETAGITEAALSAAVDTARAEGALAGKDEATARIKSILACEAAAGREAQAMGFAFETSMSAEEAIKVLGMAERVNDFETVAFGL